MVWGGSDIGRADRRKLAGLRQGAGLCWSVLPFTPTFIAFPSTPDPSPPLSWADFLFLLV